MVINMDIQDKLSNIKVIKLLRFYSYTSSVRERIAEYEDGRGVAEIKKLYERLRDLTKESKYFKNFNFDQNKCVYEVEIDGERLFVGFYDWKYSIGKSVHQFFGSRMDFVNGDEDWVNEKIKY